MAEEGDLLVVFGDDPSRCWKQIIYFNSEGRAEPVEKVSKIDNSRQDTYAEFGDILSGDETLIRDERGVRLARDDDEQSD